MTDSASPHSPETPLIDPAAFLINGPEDAPLTFAFGHGAGAPMDMPYLSFIAEGVAAQGIRVVRFEFPFRARMRREGIQLPVDSDAVLLETWRQVDRVLTGSGTLIIGGQSMGGRFASMYAAERAKAGRPYPAVACLGFPFHPPGQPDNLRTAHLEDFTTPMLVINGTKDPYGSPEEILSYPLSDCIEIHWAPDGDHDLAPRQPSPRTRDQNWQEACDRLVAFLKTHAGLI
ncbi:alpha/beta family hydrolase [Rhodovibrionaceae bacterium A322]